MRRLRSCRLADLPTRYSSTREASMKDYRSYSFWLETCGDDLTTRPPLPGPAEVDVAILGAKFTGLWTAYHLLKREPSLTVTVVNAEIAGFGVSHATIRPVLRHRWRRPYRLPRRCQDLTALPAPVRPIANSTAPYPGRGRHRPRRRDGRPGPRVSPCPVPPPHGDRRPRHAQTRDHHSELPLPLLSPRPWTPPVRATMGDQGAGPVGGVDVPNAPLSRRWTGAPPPPSGRRRGGSRARSRCRAWRRSGCRGRSPGRRSP